MSKRLAILTTVIGIAAVAAIFFGSCEPRGPLYNGKSVKEWAAQLRSSDPAVRDQANSALKSMGPTAVPTLIRLVQTKDTGVRRLWFSVGRRLPLRARRWFFQRLIWPDPNDACVAGAKGLEVIGPDARAAVPALARALRSPVPEVRLGAATALGRIGKPSVPALVEALSNKTLEVRHAAAYALGEIGPEADAAVPALVPMLAETNSPLRSSVAYSLSKIGPPNVPALTGLMAHGDSATRDGAAAVLLQYYQSLRQAMLGMVKASVDQSPQARQAALDMLSGIQQGDLLTVHLATQALNDPSVQVRLSAITALAQLGTQPQRLAQIVVPPLTESLKDESPLIRATAAHALASFGAMASPAVPALTGLIEDKNESVRATAKEALRAIQAQTNNAPGP